MIIWFCCSMAWNGSQLGSFQLCNLNLWRSRSAHFSCWRFAGYLKKSSRLTYYLSWRVCIIVGHACMLTFVLVFLTWLVCELSHEKCLLAVRRDRFWVHSQRKTLVFVWAEGLELVGAIFHCCNRELSSSLKLAVPLVHFGWNM